MAYAFRGLNQTMPSLRYESNFLQREWWYAGENVLEELVGVKCCLAGRHDCFDSLELVTSEQVMSQRRA